MREKALLESGSGNPATTVSPRKRKRGTAEGGETSSSKSQRRPKVIPNVPTVDKQDSVLESLMNEVEGIGSDTVGRSLLAEVAIFTNLLDRAHLPQPFLPFATISVRERPCAGRNSYHSATPVI